MFAATVLNSNRAVPLIGTDSFKSPAPSPVLAFPA
jgi:hypothetical protein